MIFPRLVLILLVICLMPSGVHAGGLRAGRITRLADSQLRDRLASASITLGEPVEVISRSGEEAAAVGEVVSEEAETTEVIHAAAHPGRERAEAAEAPEATE